MDDPCFDELPFSYRLSQRSMLTAVTALLFVRQLAMPQLPIPAKWMLAFVIGSIFAFALSISSYVVIRYPYLSLVQTRDGDVYSSQFTSKALARIVKAVGLLILLLLVVVLIGASSANGISNLQQVVALVYVPTLFLFVVFLCFGYDPIRYPTIATYIRSTLGLGIVLVPLFIPVLIIGSIRCRRLLDDAASRQQAGA